MKQGAGGLELQSGSPFWFRYPAGVTGAKTAAVIGAGVAGSATARQLAERGWRVAVFERAGKLEDGVGALGQLALHCRTFGDDSPLARFFLQGFLYSSREFSRLARDRGFGWHPCGLAQLPRPRDWLRKLAPSELAEKYPDAVLQWLSRESLQALTGLPMAGPGWHSPLAGWLDPLELCRCWLDHPGITLRTATAIDSIKRLGDGWRLTARNTNHKGDVEEKAFAAVVVASGADAAGFEPLRELPMRKVPGEVVFIPETPASARIRHIIRGDRGIFPAANGRHCVAASFVNGESGDGQSAAKSLALLAKNFAPEWEFTLDGASIATADRCQSADFAPIIGAVPDAAECRRRFAVLARNARAAPRRPPASLPGLYVNLAHGAYGLCGAPLAAEYLASAMDGGMPALAKDIAAALDPLRFLIRDLRRQRKPLAEGSNQAGDFP